MIWLVKAGLVFALGGGSGSVFYFTYSSDSNIAVFDFDGSASMKPIIEFLFNEYANTNPSVIFSANISSVGSKTGLDSVLSGNSSFALVSNDFDPKSYKDSWETRKLKKIALAKDPILLLYKAKSGCNNDLVLSASNYKNIFSIMSGHVYNSSEFKSNLKDLIGNGAGEECSSKIIPWVKNTGPTQSGTAKSFVKNSLLESATDCTDWKNKVQNQSYGNDYSLNFVPESTSLHWRTFVSNLKPGVMTYLPGSFVMNNWDQIDSLGIKIAKFKPNNSEIEIKKEDYVNKENDYTWSRSYYLVYSTMDVTTNINKKTMLEELVKKTKDLSKLNFWVYKYKLNGDSSESDATAIDVSKEDTILEEK